MSSDQANRPSDVAPGEVVGGKWRVGPLIGRGGMGAVYEGTNTSIGKKVALKFIDAEFAKNPDVAGRFQREAEAASLVESAHIVHVFDSGVTDAGLPYIVMELLRGQDLRGRLSAAKRLPVEEAAHIVAQVLRGLHRAHEAGIVHRDLKPDNVFLVDRDDDPLFAKIVDFGISKVNRRKGDASHLKTLTRQGVVLGTPSYMSPEQAQAFADVDLRTDLWSVGAILFECLAGRPPHLGESYETIIISICTTDAPNVRAFNPDVPAALADVVTRALQRERSERFQTAKEMLEALLATGTAKGRAVGAPAVSSGSHTISGSPATERLDANGGSPHAPSGRTRVSWTSAEPRGVGPTVHDPSGTEMLSMRASGVRRRGLLVVGLLVAGAAFVLTFAFLRSRQDRSEQDTALGGSSTSTSTGVAAASTAAAPPLVGSDEARPRQAPATSATPRDPAPVPGANSAPPAETRGPKDPPRGTTAPSPLKGHKNQPNPSPPGPTMTTPSPAPPVGAPTSSSRTGVAGGLQIKTTYP